MALLIFMLISVETWCSVSVFCLYDNLCFASSASLLMLFYFLFEMAALNADSAELSEDEVYLGLSKKMSLHCYKCYYSTCHCSGTLGRWQLCTLEVRFWMEVYICKWSSWLIWICSFQVIFFGIHCTTKAFKVSNNLKNYKKKKSSITLMEYCLSQGFFP